LRPLREASLAFLASEPFFGIRNCFENTVGGSLDRDFFHNGFICGGCVHGGASPSFASFEPFRGYFTPENFGAAVRLVFPPRPLRPLREAFLAFLASPTRGM